MIAEINTPIMIKGTASIIILIKIVFNCRNELLNKTTTPIKETDERIRNRDSIYACKIEQRRCAEFAMLTLPLKLLLVYHLMPMVTKI
jgi:hypothetical protein